jgi:hypothetical protein
VKVQDATPRTNAALPPLFQQQQQQQSNNNIIFSINIISA